MENKGTAIFFGLTGVGGLLLALYMANKDGYFGRSSGTGDGGSVGGADQQQASNNPTVVGLTSPTNQGNENVATTNNVPVPNSALSQSSLFQPAPNLVPLNRGGSVRLNESTYNPVSQTGTDYLGQGFSRAPNALDRAVIYVNRNTGVSIDPAIAAKNQSVNLGSSIPPPLTTKEIAANLISGKYASSQPQSIDLQLSSPVKSSGGGSNSSQTKLSATTVQKSQGKVSVSGNKVVVTSNKSKINVKKK